MTDEKAMVKNNHIKSKNHTQKQGLETNKSALQNPTLPFSEDKLREDSSFYQNSSNLPEAKNNSSLLKKDGRSESEHPPEDKLREETNTKQKNKVSPTAVLGSDKKLPEENSVPQKVEQNDSSPEAILSDEIIWKGVHPYKEGCLSVRKVKEFIKNLEKDYGDIEMSSDVYLELVRKLKERAGRELLK